MPLEFTLSPANGVSPPPPSRVQVELIYQAIAPTDAVDTEDTESLTSAVRTPLGDDLKVLAKLPDFLGPDLVVRLLRGDGTIAVEETIRPQQSNVADFELTSAHLDKIKNSPNPAKDDASLAISGLAKRTLRLMPLTSDMLDFKTSKVMVSTFTKLSDLKNDSLEKLLGLVGGAVKNSTALDITNLDMSGLLGVLWQPARLTFDGVIEADFPLQQTEGWLWWIAGAQQFVGLVPDNLAKANTRSLTVALRVEPRQQKSGGSQASVTTSESCKDCGKAVPGDYSEREIVEQPGVYTEDPGSACRPFSNPERVLGEKSFSVISRVDTPEIGAKSSLKSRSMKLLDLDRASNPNPAPQTGFLARIFSSQLPALAPLSRKLKLSDSIVNHFKSFSPVRREVSSAHPVQWEDDISQYQACSVALGHLLEYRIRWRSNGYSLGTVSSTLTLAPRQVKRIQKIEWSRRESAKREEKTRLTDEVNDSNLRDYEYQDEVAASLSEWSQGSSAAVTASVAGGAGFAAPGVVGGVGGGVGSAASTASQSGGRRTAASEDQRLRDAIRRHGDSVRRLESTVVQEVSQDETSTGTSEVLRNFNYGRSISVIYYQILRHLKVSTEFAGARECLFIPFAIKPFDVDRAYRWREAIQKRIRSRRFLKALRFLKDVRDNFANSDIPPGARSTHRITSLRGSIYMKIAIERPADKADGKADSSKWAMMSPFIEGTVGVALSRLQSLKEEVRDDYFQKHTAPQIAANWCNGLKLQGGIGFGRFALLADFTMATAYRPGQVVRVDFTVSSAQGSLTRQQLQNLRVTHTQKLSPGSVVHLTGMSYTYTTDYHQRSEQGQTGINDLLNPETGAPGSALISFPLDAWDNVEEQKEITRSANDLVEHLNEHIEYYHKAIWWNMDRDRLLMMLDGFLVPGRKDVSIATVVDREPLAIIGNSLVYRVGAGSFIGCPGVTTPEELYNLYSDKQPVRDPLLVSLPTDGLYARTIMDECPALEEYQGSTDWVLSQPDIEVGSIDASMLATRRADLGSALNPTTLPDTIINQQQTENAPAKLLEKALSNVSGAFADRTGLAANQANAISSLQTAASLASQFSNQAAASQAAQLASDAQAGKDLNSFRAAVQQAVKEEAMSPEAGKQSMDDFAIRKASGGQSGNKDDLHKQVLSSDSEASHSTIDKDGTIKTTEKKPAPKREADPVASVSVVPIDNEQVLFLNFATGKSALLDDHIRYLERLAGEIGVSIDDVVSIEGHASTSGSIEDNEELGKERAFAIFNRLHALVTPLGAAPNFSPAFLSTTGETGSYRARFAHVPAIANINQKDKGHPNDPVEKAVLFTFKKNSNRNLDPKPDEYDCGGTKISVINNYIYVGGRIICSLPNDGPVRVMERPTVNLLNDNVVNNEIRIDNKISMKAEGNKISFINIDLSGWSFGRDPVTGKIGEPEPTGGDADKEYDTWQIKLFPPEIVNAKSLADLLDSVVQIALDLASSVLPANTPQKLQDFLAHAKILKDDNNTPPDKKQLELLEFLLDALGLLPAKTLLGMVRFGDVKMRGQIKVPGKGLKIEGLFTSSGLVVGTTDAQDINKPILNNAEYKTNKALKIADWENQANFQDFSFIDNGPVSAVLSGGAAVGHLISALQIMATQMMPDIIQMLSNAITQGALELMRNFQLELAKYTPQSSITFRAFAEDDRNQIQQSSVNASGAQLRIVTMTPNQISFTKS